MPFYLTPITVALIILSLLLIFAAMPATRLLRHRFTMRRRLIILELPTSLTSNKIKALLGELQTPFIFETAVHHLGKESHSYLLVPRVYAEQVKSKTGGKEVYDYNIYHSGGSHLGFYLKALESSSFNLGEVDFSRVNEIGEGAVVQLVVKKQNGGNKLANLRVLVSAPTSYQAQEISLGINSSLTNFKPIAVTKGLQEFIHKVNYREFDEEQATTWSSA
jgi:hypothetical protein